MKTIVRIEYCIGKYTKNEEQLFLLLQKDIKRVLVEPENIEIDIESIIPSLPDTITNYENVKWNKVIEVLSGNWMIKTAKYHKPNYNLTVIYILDNWLMKEETLT